MTMIDLVGKLNQYVAEHGGSFPSELVMSRGDLRAIVYTLHPCVWKEAEADFPTFLGLPVVVRSGAEPEFV